MKAYLVGRHNSQIPGMEIIGTENANYPARSKETSGVLRNILEHARAAGAEAVIFQALPPQLANAIRCAWWFDLPMYAVVSVPGERPAGKQMVFEGSDETVSQVADAVQFANQNARLLIENGTVTVTVDPPMVFQFSHLERLG